MTTAEPGDAPGNDAAPSGPPSFPGNAPPPAPAGTPSPGPAVFPSTGAGARPGGMGPPTFPTQSGYPPPGPYETPSGAPYATWGIRVGGYLIDAVIFLVVLVVLFVLPHTHALELHLAGRRGTRRRNFSAVPFLITGVLWIAYGTFLCGSPRGQTVGMMAVGVRAVRDESLGELGYGRALGRALFEGVLRLINLLFFLLGLVWILDMLFPLWDKKRQTLHDKVAGSVVLRTRPAG